MRRHPHVSFGLDLSDAQMEALAALRTPHGGPSPVGPGVLITPRLLHPEHVGACSTRAPLGADVGAGGMARWLR